MMIQEWDRQGQWVMSDASHWSAMYIGVSSLLLGKIPDNDEEELDEDNSKTNSNKSSSSLASTPSFPASQHPSPNLDINHEAEFAAAVVDGNGSNINVSELLEDRENLRTQILQYQASTTKTKRQRRMSALDHEVLHSALTMEIVSLTAALQKKTKELEETNPTSVCCDHAEDNAAMQQQLRSNEETIQGLKLRMEQYKVEVEQAAKDLVGVREAAAAAAAEVVAQAHQRNLQTNQKAASCGCCV